MVTTLEQLISEKNNPFQLSLVAGNEGKKNVVNWIYMLEDENIIPFFHGGELIVTTGIKQTRYGDWLLLLIRQLHAKGAAGLIVNTGKFVTTIPQPVIDYCNEQDFPLLTMPWEIHITQMTQSLCLSIINNQQENQIHDQAMQGTPSYVREMKPNIAGCWPPIMTWPLILLSSPSMPKTARISRKSPSFR